MVIFILDSKTSSNISHVRQLLIKKKKKTEIMNMIIN
jgi:hypothetical protein